MTPDDESDSINAEAYAIGALSGSAYEEAKARASADARFAATAAALDTLLAPLTRSLPPLDAPDDLLDQIEARIDALPRSAIVRASEGEWTELTPGARIKVLNIKPEIRRYSYLLELDAGAIADPHDHDDDEECYVISGDISFGDAAIGPGDFHLAPKGSQHGSVRSTNGCRCLIIAAWHG